MTERRPDWPIGPWLERHRLNEQISARAAARRTNGRISDGRWYQLESGYQRIKGHNIPISTTPSTVIAAARAVRGNPEEALRVAGFDPADAPKEPEEDPLVRISEMTDDELLAELCRRLRGRHQPKFPVPEFPIPAEMMGQTAQPAGGDDAGVVDDQRGADDCQCACR